MAIIWFDTVKRLTLSMGPLTRAGYLEKKTTSVDRVFDHLAFSWREGAPEMKLLVRIGGKEQVLTKPHCMLFLPGDHSVTIPLAPCNEFYFVIQHPERILGDRKPLRGEFGELYPEADSRLFTYMKLFLEMFGGPVSPNICTQLDCLALAMLGCTYYGGLSADRISPVEAIEGYINNHYTDEIDFEKLAKQYGLSLSTFRRQWNRQKEETPGQMILRLRNRTALELLRNRQLSIGEVAELTGYPDIRYFSRFFRRMNHMTPSEFRSRQMEEDNHRNTH
jgi:two-component system response regulator YesN